MGSDHAVFGELNVPYLFFCCGVCDELHQSGDTADKLNHTDIQHDVNVIVVAVRALADESERARPASRPASQPVRPAPL